MHRELQLSDEAATVAFGGALAAALTPGLILYLSGELGAGKTTLTRGIARGLGHNGAVKSPTYTLVEPYLDLNPPLYHFDLYRLGDPEELEYMGIRDYLGDAAVAVIEWPERGRGFLPGPDLAITMAVVAEGRRLRLEAATEAGTACLRELVPEVEAARAGGGDC